MDRDIDRAQKHEQVESDTRTVRQEGEIWNTSEVPELAKEKPASWKEISEAADKGFGYAKDKVPNQDELTRKMDWD